MTKESTSYEGSCVKRRPHHPVKVKAAQEGSPAPLKVMMTPQESTSTEVEEECQRVENQDPTRALCTPKPLQEQLYEAHCGCAGPKPVWDRSCNPDEARFSGADGELHKSCYGGS